MDMGAQPMASSELAAGTPTPGHLRPAEEHRWAARYDALEPVGEGATAIVWRARALARASESAAVAGSGRRLVALKVAKGPGPPMEAIAREAALLARVDRRWGPALIDAGPGFVVTEWIDGEALAPSSPSPSSRRLLASNDERSEDRERIAAGVAHACARALEELHQAGVRHGDVKPQNVLCGARALGRVEPGRDAAEDRAATLIDLGLATRIEGEALGGTLRYAAPE